jgi:hypothetical protein
LACCSRDASIVRFRRRTSRPILLPQLSTVIELLSGMGTMLMAIDEKLDRIISILEEDE